MDEPTRERLDAVVLKDWLFDFLDRCTGDPCSFFAVLKRSGGDADARDPLTHVEYDVADLFKEVIDDLVSAMGSEAAVMRWLRHSSAFKAAGASSPLFYIEEGDVWCLHLLSAVIKLWINRPCDALGLRAEVLQLSLRDHPEIEALYDAVFGASTVPEKWFFLPALGLGGERPIDVLQKPGGANSVRHYLSQIDAGVYV